MFSLGIISLYQPTKIKTFNSSFAEYPVLEKLVKNTDAAGRLSLCQHMEHPTGFEPVIRELQSLALPLG